MFENVKEAVRIIKNKRVRYCYTSLHKIYPRGVGWLCASNDGVEDCQDEPMEKNCRYIVRECDLKCPTCGKPWYSI